MIIYPVIILVLLLVAFSVIYRKAYVLESVMNPAQIEKKLEKLKTKEVKDESEVSLKEELEENFKKAEDLFRKKQYISAEKWYIEAAKVDPKNDMIYARLGVIYIDQKNFKDAIEALEEAARLGPAVAGRYFNLSFAKNALGEKREALNFAKKAVRIDSKNEKYRKWFEELKSSPF